MSVCQNDWSRRVWVLQGYTLAKRAVFMLGWRLISDEMLTGTVTRMYERTGVHKSSLTSMNFQPPLNFIDASSRFRTKLGAPSQESQYNSAIWALPGTQQFKVTDHRDRVYGIFGLVREIDISSFDIDYTESLKDFSRRLSDFLMRKCPTPMYFYNLAALDMSEKPSWMMNLANPRKRSGFELFVGSADVPSDYRAGGCAPIQPQLSEGRNVLKLKEIVMDAISARSEPFPPYPNVSGGHEVTAALCRIASTWVTRPFNLSATDSSSIGSTACSQI